MYNYKAKVTSIYDGDTITVEIDLGFHVKIIKEKIRLYGLDAPEIRGETRGDGLASRDFLRKQILDSEVTLVTFKDKRGKYGRYIGVVIKDDININQLMIEAGYAIKRKY